MHLFVNFEAFLQTEVTDCPTRSYTLTTKFPLFFPPEAWKRYPFRGEPPRKGKYREHCIYSLADDIVTSLKQNFQNPSNLKNN